MKSLLVLIFVLCAATAGAMSQEEVKKYCGKEYEYFIYNGSAFECGCKKVVQYNNCVTLTEVKWALENSASKWAPMSGITTMTLECNPCRCGDIGSSACYEYQAAQAREKEKNYEKFKDILKRLNEVGMCK